MDLIELLVAVPSPGQRLRVITYSTPHMIMNARKLGLKLVHRVPGFSSCPVSAMIAISFHRTPPRFLGRSGPLPPSVGD